MQPSSTRDTISIPELNVESETEEDIQPKSKRKRGSIKKKFEEKKLEILEGCSNMLAQSRSPSAEKPQSITSPFALYVDEKLKLLDKRTRVFNEKRIMDSQNATDLIDSSNQPQPSHSAKSKKPLPSKATIPVKPPILVKPPCAGLINKGNTCYANSILEALKVIPTMWSHLSNPLSLICIC